MLMQTSLKDICCRLFPHGREIEDFLCHLEKGIKRVRENRHSMIPLENELDDIIKDILKANK